MIKITRKDILWNYSGSILNIGVNLILLPIILRYLPTNDLGLWYVFGSIASLVLLLDFGFSPTIMRNLVYAWTGADDIKEQGVPVTLTGALPNSRLMETIIIASKKIYLIIALLAAVILLVIGTPYISVIVDGNYSESIVAWLIFSFGIVMNLYYSYWNPLLKGVGGIKQANQILVITKSSYLIFTGIGLIFGGGLIWLSLMYVTSGFIIRFFSKIAYKNLTNTKINLQVTSKEIKDIFKKMWPNAKKQGFITLGAWLITRSTTIFSSYYFGLTVTAQYGLSLQLLSFVGVFSVILFSAYSPELASAKTLLNDSHFKRIFSRTIFVQWVIGIIGVISIIYLAPILLNLINANSTLLPTKYLLLMGIIIFLEQNHATFASLITLTNRVPFLRASLISGLLIIVMSLLSIYLTNLGVLGLIIVQGIVQLSYNNWYWPRFVLKEGNFTIMDIIKIAIKDFSILLKKFYN